MFWNIRGDFHRLLEASKTYVECSGVVRGILPGVVWKLLEGPEEDYADFWKIPGDSSMAAACSPTSFCNGVLG